MYIDSFIELSCPCNTIIVQCSSAVDTVFCICVSWWQNHVPKGSFTTQLMETVWQSAHVEHTEMCTDLRVNAGMVCKHLIVFSISVLCPDFTAGIGLFFNQTSTRSNMLLSNIAETPIATIKLVADKNLAKNGSVRFYHNHYFVTSYYYINTYQFMTNTRIDVNGQTAHADFVFNSTNPTECSNGTHTFRFVVVNIYINATGEINFHLNAQMYNQGYYYSQSFDVTASISNGIVETTCQKININTYILLSWLICTSCRLQRWTPQLWLQHKGVCWNLPMWKYSRVWILSIL